MARVVVTGAGRGLGLALVTALLEAGHSVGAGLRRRTAAHEALAARYGEQLLLFEADVCDAQQLAAGAEACREAFGELDALCNVAGILLDSDRERPLHEAVIEDLRETFEVNVVGAIMVIQAFLPLLREGARALTITSEGVDLASCGSWVPAYALSKTAATKASGILNRSVEGIDFFAVHPGRMNTDMGRTTAQIEPEEAALGILPMLTGEQALDREQWYIDYRGQTLL